MNQLQLNLILPPGDVGRKSLPTSDGYHPDWECEQEAFFEGDRVLYKGKGATINKVWQHIQKARICVDKTFRIYTVPFAELEPLVDTVEVGNAHPPVDDVGREDKAIALPTQKCPENGHLTFEIGRKYYLKSDGRAVFLEKLYKKRAKVCDRDFNKFNVDIDDLSETGIQLSLPINEAVPVAVLPKDDVEPQQVALSIKETLLKRIAHYEKQCREATSLKTRGKLNKKIRKAKERIETLGIGHLVCVEMKVKDKSQEWLTGKIKAVRKNGQSALVEWTDDDENIEEEWEPVWSLIPVGRKDPDNLLPTQNNVGRKDPDNLLPTHFYEAAKEWDLSSLYQMRAYLEHKIRERGYSVEPRQDDSEKSCREKNLLPTQNVGRKEVTESLPTSSNNNDYPHPYIEAKRLPYKTKSGEKKYRKNPYYFLRDHHDKGKSKYLASKRENIPEELLGLKIYGEDEIPF